MIEAYRNQGGFDLIGSGRDKIETTEQFDASLQICQQLQLNGLVVIGMSSMLRAQARTI